MEINGEGLRARKLVTPLNPGAPWDLDLPARGIVGLSGPSGAGKSTLLQALAGLRGCSGDIHWSGICWQSGNRRLAAHRRDACVGFQDCRLFAGTSVAENLALVHRHSRRPLPPAERQQLLAGFGATDLLDKPVESLSGGEAQRVALLRQLFSNPALQLCDEALSAVDRPLRLRLLPQLWDFWQRHQALVVWASHSVEEIQLLADSCLWMECGHLRGPLPTPQVAARLADEKMPEYSRIDARVTEQRAGLLRLSLEGHSLYADRAANNYRVGQAVHFLLAAGDISLSVAHPGLSSALNCLPVRLDNLEVAGDGRVRLLLSVGEAQFCADISGISCERLALKAGKNYFAQFKACAPLGL
ncbi:ATP-binding cassette domain-containing protein [Microbulbifer rhizosphaerae]|uniref:Molybdate transport system ATP-binding protein n=1 Tax=Microbulbifer rhizosphaerae TaxID=1562603 RepID=A0A7W4WDQ4_9GAMM|nr:ATP-binding cassette domain-containing protein [Microbulbifer rhizosphaerae]MBB3062356.1 molybdate transport system ATP-binding protein [Microbulbifer rhizosphaerae]